MPSAAKHDACAVLLGYVDYTVLVGGECALLAVMSPQLNAQGPGHGLRFRFGGGRGVRTVRTAGYRLGSDRGSPNHGSTLLSKRVIAQIRSPESVRT